METQQSRRSWTYPEALGHTAGRPHQQAWHARETRAPPQSAAAGGPAQTGWSECLLLLAHTARPPVNRQHGSDQ